MNYAVPGGHPPQDMLADLAAEVLDVEQARTVEAHVMTCRHCEQVLVDAERVRSLLAGPHPGPMPADVWTRIESSLAAEAAAHGAGGGAIPSGGTTAGWFDVPTTPAPYSIPPAPVSPMPPPGPPMGSPMIPPAPSAPMIPPAPVIPPAPPRPAPAPAPVPPPPFSASPVTAGRSEAPDTGSMFLPKDGQLSVPLPPPELSFDEAPTAAWRLFLNEEDPEPPVEPVQQKVGRAVRSMRSRRDVRTENDTTPRWRRPGPLLALAAAGLAVIGLGGFGIMTVLDDGDPDVLPAALPGTSSRSIVHNSGADYTLLTLPVQVKALVRYGTPVVPSASGAKGASPSASGAKGASPSASKAPAPTTPKAAPAAAAKAGTVSDPQQLQACLTALGETSRKPLAVDLGRWQGREAAVIVLPGVNGGYDVWVVARDCRPGAEGHLAYKSIPN